MGLSVTEGAGYLVVFDDDDGLLFYHQIALGSGSSGGTVAMPYTTDMPAATGVIAGQRTSNTPIAISNTIGTVTATTAQIYSKFTRTNGNADCISCAFYS